MLSSARSSRRGLSRRDWLKLGAAGAAACAMPTLHLAEADGPADDRPAPVGKIYVNVSFVNGPEPRDRDRGIFAINPDTGAHERLRDLENSIRLTRDGRTIAVVRHGKSAGGQDPDLVGVWTGDTDGQGALRPITDFPGTVSWSPDGKQLIVAHWLSNADDDAMRFETWRFNADSTGATQLPIPETDEVDDWSPDGDWLVTVSDRHPPHGRGYQLYVMHPDGTGQRRLTEGPGLNVYARFSPDGKQIAYHHQDRDGDSIWIVDRDGKGRRRVLAEENDVAPQFCCWSPDGKRLAITLETWQRDEQNRKVLGLGDSNPQIVIVDIDGKNRRTLDLPHADWIGTPSWR